MPSVATAAGLALVALLVMSCRTGPAAEGGSAERGQAKMHITRSPATSQSAPGVLFPEQLPREKEYLMAELRGRLTLDEAGCLRVRYRGGSVTPVWPPGLKVDVTGDGVQILDQKGRIAARVGEGVYMGGGETRALDDLMSVGERTAQELRDRCPGTYWLVAPPVRVP